MPTPVPPRDPFTAQSADLTPAERARPDRSCADRPHQDRAHADPRRADRRRPRGRSGAAWRGEGCRTEERRRGVELLRGTRYGGLAVSLDALPYVVPARHVVVDGALLLRLHRGHGYHRACDGQVVAYGAQGDTAAADANPADRANPANPANRADRADDRTGRDLTGGDLTSGDSAENRGTEGRGTEGRGTEGRGSEDGGVLGRADGLWFVQLVGTARLCTPSAAQLELFQDLPSQVDGVPFDPVYLRLEPRLVTVHRTELPPVCQAGPGHRAP